MIQTLCTQDLDITVACGSAGFVRAADQGVEVLVADSHQCQRHTSNVCGRNERALGAAGAGVDGVLLGDGFEVVALGEIFCWKFDLERDSWRSGRRPARIGMVVRTHEPRTSQHSVPHLPTRAFTLTQQI